MKLRDLDAQFLTFERCTSCEYHESGGVHHRRVPTLAEAHGVEFLCPLCFAANSGPVGTHMVVCWFVGKVPDEAFPKPGRWTPQGTGLDDLSFVPGSGRNESVKIEGGCAWHGYVRNGDAA